MTPITRNPSDARWTKKDFAIEVERSLAAIEKMVEAGIPRVREGRRWYYTVASLRWFYDRQIDALERVLSPDLQKARARKELALAKLAESKLAREQGAVVPISEVTRDYGMVLQTVRRKLLNVPGKFALRILPAFTRAEAQKVLFAMVREIIPELRSDYVEEEAA